MNYFSHLECGNCRKELESDKLWNLCPECDKPLLARYDLKKARSSMERIAFKSLENTLWRYHELLPVKDPRFRLSLGEGYTPLVHAKRLGRKTGFEKLFIKDEGLNPTGSFKARGISVALSRAVELGIKSVSLPSAGNAAGALCAYAALARLPAFVFMPYDVPRPFIAECRAFGGHINLINGLITDCGKHAAEAVAKYGHFDLATLKEPFRIEGKKTMGYELAEQMDWTLPDVIIYPTGGGTGLVGMWKAFAEMEELGWIDSNRPRMVAVQSTGCAPMVKAFKENKTFAEPWKGAITIADGLRVPSAVGDFLILKSLRESNGTAIAVPDEEILADASAIGHTQGIFASPEGGATLAAFKHLREQGWIKDYETVVLFNTGAGQKYYHLWDSNSHTN